MTALLEARDISAGYAGTPAIRDINLSVGAGEIVALLGPNGAGKSTTLLTLAGELRPLSGEVFLDGRPTSEPLFRRARRGVSIVTEERSVFTSLTAGANLRLGRGSEEEALRLFPELRPLLGRLGGQLSGGEQQMLTLARALASAPRVLLADELSLGLAPLVVRRLLDAVSDASARGIGILLVEQHARQALQLADRAYILDRGRVTLTGSGKELLGRLDEIEESYLDGPPAD